MAIGDCRGVVYPTANASCQFRQSKAPHSPLARTYRVPGQFICAGELQKLTRAYGQEFCRRGRIDKRFYLDCSLAHAVHLESDPIIGCSPKTVGDGTIRTAPLQVHICEDPSLPEMAHTVTLVVGITFEESADCCPSS
jgi:hypothetical protein